MKFLQFAALIIFTASVSAVSAKGPEPDVMGLPVPCYDTWYRYYGAGEKALKAHNDELADRYFMSSLAELEKVNAKQNSKDLFFMVRLSGIEQRLVERLTNKVAATTGDDQKELSVRKEQVDAYERMARVNERIVVPNTDLIVVRAKERFVEARKQYDKRATEIKNKQTQNGTTTDSSAR